MTREELKELGYNEEQVEELILMHGKATQKIKSELEETVTKLSDSETELSKRNKDIEELRNKSTSDEDLKAKLEGLEQEYKTYQEEATQREAKYKFDSALNLELAKSGTIDEVSLRANLDMDSIELTEDGLKGLDEQLVALKENKSFLFGEKLNGGLKHGKAIPKETVEEVLRKSMDLK